MPVKHWKLKDLTVLTRDLREDGTLKQVVALQSNGVFDLGTVELIGGMWVPDSRLSRKVQELRQTDQELHGRMSFADMDKIAPISDSMIEPVLRGLAYQFYMSDACSRIMTKVKQSIEKSYNHLIGMPVINSNVGQGNISLNIPVSVPVPLQHIELTLSSEWLDAMSVAERKNIVDQLNKDLEDAGTNEDKPDPG